MIWFKSEVKTITFSMLLDLQWTTMKDVDIRNIELCDFKNKNVKNNCIIIVELNNKRVIGVVKEEDHNTLERLIKENTKDDTTYQKPANNITDFLQVPEELV